MLSLSRGKVVLNLIVCLVGLLLALPNILPPHSLKGFPEWLTNTVNLGLELRGGSHLQFEVDLKAVKKDLAHSLVYDIRALLRKEQIGYTGLNINAIQPSVVLNLRDPLQYDKAIAAMRKLDRENLEVNLSKDGLVTIQYTENYLAQKMLAVIDQSITVIHRRIDEFGMKEPNIFRQGTDRIIVQLPGIEDPAEVKRLIGKTAKMTFRLVDHSVEPITVAAGTPTPRISLPPGVELLPEPRDGSVTYLAVKKTVAVSGEQLDNSQVTTHEGRPAVSLKFNPQGSRKFAEMSATNLRKQFAIVLDNVVISAPVFESVIPDGNGQISGHFTFKEATDLAVLLRAGALPTQLKVVEERTIGPSLGADSIYDGKVATTLAIVLVGIFMVLNYSLFGVFADIALIFNIIFLFAALSLFQATLTLPGIAGIALTVGMAVDSNVLIYERIKEEIRHGAKAVQAIEAGYRRAFMTIIDSNITTLIGAAVLFEFGSGPIRGFAVTLALGILISLFTTLSLNRMVIISWLRRRRPQTLPI